MTENNSWTDEALCSGVSLKIVNFFHSNDEQEQAQAKSLCFSCPVRQMCIQDALDNEERWGIRGGADATEFRRVQSIDSTGKPYIHSNKPIRCPFCGPRSTKFLDVLEYKRTRTHVICTNCNTTWWTRKLINKKKTNW